MDEEKHVDLTKIENLEAKLGEKASVTVKMK